MTRTKDSSADKAHKYSFNRLEVQLWSYNPIVHIISAKPEQQEKRVVIYARVSYKK